MFCINYLKPNKTKYLGSQTNYCQNKCGRQLFIFFSFLLSADISKLSNMSDFCLTVMVVTTLRQMPHPEMDYLEKNMYKSLFR